MKKTIRENFRLEVRTFERGLTQREVVKALEQIIAEVRRHVDGVESASVVCDTYDVCQHCGYRWKTEKDGTPCCCDKAIEEFEQQQAQAGKG